MDFRGNSDLKKTSGVQWDPLAAKACTRDNFFFDRRAKIARENSTEIKLSSYPVYFRYFIILFHLILFSLCTLLIYSHRECLNMLSVHCLLEILKIVKGNFIETNPIVVLCTFPVSLSLQLLVL